MSVVKKEREEREEQHLWFSSVVLYFFAGD